MKVTDTGCHLRCLWKGRKWDFFRKISYTDTGKFAAIPCAVGELPLTCYPRREWAFYCESPSSPAGPCCFLKYWHMFFCSSQGENSDTAQAVLEFPCKGLSVWITHPGHSSRNSAGSLCSTCSCLSHISKGCSASLSAGAEMSCQVQADVFWADIGKGH